MTAVPALAPEVAPHALMKDEQVRLHAQTWLASAVAGTVLGLPLAVVLWPVVAPARIGI